MLRGFGLIGLVVLLVVIVAAFVIYHVSTKASESSPREEETSGDKPSLMNLSMR
jgi:hypothetical protein